MENTYILRLRRGIKYVDKDGATLRYEDGTPVQDDWATYSAQPNHLNPLDGELVLEYQVYPDGKKIPRLKIGDGEHTFADLEYMSVDSFISPTHASVTLLPGEWSKVDGYTDRYYQFVEVKNAAITANSKVDLQPSPEQLTIFHEKDVAFTAINAGGQVRVCAIGQKPTQEYTMQVTVTEVFDNGNS